MNAFSNLSAREKLLVLLVLPAVILFALYQFAWLPLSLARIDAKIQIASYRALTQAAGTQGDQTRFTAPVAPPTTPLPTRITQSAVSAGVLVRRLEPDGALVRVTLDDAPFDAVIAWIVTMEADHAITLVSLELDRRTVPGIVAARLALETSR